MARGQKSKEWPKSYVNQVNCDLGHYLFMDKYVCFLAAEQKNLFFMFCYKTLNKIKLVIWGENINPIRRNHLFIIIELLTFPSLLVFLLSAIVGYYGQIFIQVFIYLYFLKSYLTLHIHINNYCTQYQRIFLS